MSKLNKLEDKQKLNNFRRFAEWFVKNINQTQQTNLSCGCNYRRGDHVWLGAPMITICREHQSMFDLEEYYYLDEVHYFNQKREENKTSQANL